MGSHINPINTSTAADASVVPTPSTVAKTVDVKKLRRQLRDRTQYLRIMCRDVVAFLAWMDREMVKPSTHERGKRIAQACNALDLSVQSARRFGLGKGVKR